MNKQTERLATKLFIELGADSQLASMLVSRNHTVLTHWEQDSLRNPNNDQRLSVLVNNLWLNYTATRHFNYGHGADR